MAFCPETPKEESPDSQGGVLKLSRFGLLQLCRTITFCSDLWLGRGLKQNCSSCQEISNSVSHSTSKHRGRVDSRLLVVGNQIVSLTPDLSFCHNLCYKCPNGSIELIFYIYTSIAFQWYNECFNARCFGPCHWTWSFGSPGGLPNPRFGNVNLILTLSPSRVATD
jgi:hypothetical protein